ncbi:putative beta-1,4-galactosyltransferase [Schistosoma mansoni]|uniref:putative beta-1,4-galactosyltransferase n=1 Tax=Schistosoma mansoni TaxID=6183 RepID=UPI00022DCA52|nr:putative beta-1,4-galactosyltransferase [Schistosoma mansoni]|eukprot:XP_018655333.1 putative beta-1,4-galactosyltransferase [Schistosoma mansoni]
MLFTSLINSPSKCLLIVLFLIGTTYVFYLWSGKFKETNNPVFVINYASIDNPFIGHVKTPNKVLFWPQIQYKYTLPQSVDFITPNSSVKNFKPQQVFGSFYTKCVHIIYVIIVKRLIYERFFGGVVTFTRDQYLKINGFSNLYEGWGGEDDDLLLRVEQSGYNLSRINELIGRYYALSHNTDELNEKNPERFKLLKTSESRFKSDGLNSLKYTVTQSKSMYNGLIYWISIDIHPKNS